MLVDEEIGVAFAGDAQHGVVEVLDPARNRFSIAQLDVDHDLAIAERAQVEGFLSGLTGRRGLGAAAGGEWSHGVILDAGRVEKEA